jgi:hypothetical protein
VQPPQEASLSVRMQVSTLRRSPRLRHTLACMATPEQIEMVKSHLSKHAKNVNCPVCNTDKWYIAGPAMAPLWDNQKNLMLNSSIPMILLICEQCSYIRSFAYFGIDEVAAAKAEKRRIDLEEKAAQKAAEPLKKAASQKESNNVG